jgi:predicted  nucleic acid-binding Zn-ribbon protein
MPHQCLKCGEIFEEGSSQLLKGCPVCSGNRFFFTKNPLDKEARKLKTDEVKKDINQVLVDLMSSDKKEMVDKSGKWLNLKPKDLRKAFANHLPENGNINKNKKDKKDDIAFLNDEEYRKKRISELESKSELSNTPETIDIEKPGKYHIDLKGLLDQEPIIIQKDGSYTIHLPSIFKMIDKKKH